MSGPSSMYVFESDGSSLPPGEYLVTIYDDEVTIAHREQRWGTWGPPLYGVER